MSVREAAGGPSGGADPSENVVAVEPSVDTTAADLQSRRPWVAGALGATWAFFVGLTLLSCLVLGVWALSSTPAGDSGAAWRAVGLAWLGAHQTDLTISGLPVTVLPLGAVLAGLLLTRRGGRWSARLVPDPTIRELCALVCGAALAYGAGAAGVAWLSGTPSTGATLGHAFLACGAVAAVGASWGIARELDLPGRVQDRVSPGMWRTLLAGCAGGLGLFVVGAGLVALSLILHVADAARALAAFDGGILAAAGVTLANVLTLPTLAMWAAAYAAGPGFSLGGLGSVSAFGGDVAALPALPVLVAVPATVPGWAPVLLLGPVVCGVIAGRVRWQADVPSWPGALTSALGVGVVVAPLVAGAVLLTSGSFGGGALSQIGPEVGQVTGAAVGLVVLGFLAEALGQSLWLWWDLHQAEQRAAGGVDRVDDRPDPVPDPGDDPDPAVAAGMPEPHPAGAAVERGQDQSGGRAVGDAGVREPGVRQPSAGEPSVRESGVGQSGVGEPKRARPRSSAVVGVRTAIRSKVMWASSLRGLVEAPEPERSQAAEGDTHVTVVVTRESSQTGAETDGAPANSEDLAEASVEHAVPEVAADASVARADSEDTDEASVEQADSEDTDDSSVEQAHAEATDDSSVEQAVPENPGAAAAPPP